jgi:hypothetical protein
VAVTFVETKICNNYVRLGRTFDACFSLQLLVSNSVPSGHHSLTVNGIAFQLINQVSLLSFLNTGHILKYLVSIPVYSL